MTLVPLPIPLLPRSISASLLLLLVHDQAALRSSEDLELRGAGNSSSADASPAKIETLVRNNAGKLLLASV